MSAPETLSDALADGWSDEDVYGSAELDSEREHHHQGCHCGCAFTAGLTGTVIEVSRELDVVIAEFAIPSLTGGSPRLAQTAYSFAEVDAR
jgi:hypothetical protein